MAPAGGGDAVGESGGPSKRRRLERSAAGGAEAGQSLGVESGSGKSKDPVMSKECLEVRSEDSQRIVKEIEDLKSVIDEDLRQLGYCEENEKLRAELSAKVKEIHCLMKRIEELEAKSDFLRKRHEELIAINDGLRKRNVELQAKNDDLTKQNKELQAKNNSLTKGNEVLEAINDALRKWNVELQAKNNGLTKGNEVLEAINDGLRKWNVELQAKNNNLTKQNKELQAKNNGLTKGNEEFEAINDGLRKRNVEVQAKNDDLTKQNKVLQAKNNSLTKGNEELQAKSNDLHKNDLETKKNATKLSISRLEEDSRKLHEAYNEEMRNLRHRAGENALRIFLENQNLRIYLANKRRELNIRAKELEKMSAENANDRKTLDDEKQKLEDLSVDLVTKERESNDKLQQARKELIKGLEGDLGGRTAIGIKRMGKLDEKPFQNACKRKHGKGVYQWKAAELVTFWQKELENPSWHPFKMVQVNGENKEILVDNDTKLKYLQIYFGDDVCNAVKTALMEINEYNPTGRRFVVPELWNFRKGRKATMKEMMEVLKYLRR